MNIETVKSAQSASDALAALKIYFDECYAPSQIDDGVRLLIANIVNFKNLPELKDVFASLQKAVSEKMLAMGETPDAFYCALFVLACDLEQDKLIAETIISLKEYYTSLPHSEAEQLVVRNLLFALGILNGEAESAFDWYFINTVTTELDKMESIPDGARLFTELLIKLDISIERVISLYKTLLNPDVFFALNKIQRRSIFAWGLHIIWGLPPYFNNLKWMQLADDWKRTLKLLLEKNLIDEAMYVHFYIHHKMGNSAQGAEPWIEFNKDVEYPCSIAYKQYSDSLNLPPCKPKVAKIGKIRIALLKERVVMNSPFRVEYGILKELQADEEFRSKYEICVISMNYYEKSHDSAECVKLLQDIDVPLYSPAYMMCAEHYYVSHLQKALVIRDAIIKDCIDILIACTNNFAIESFLLGSRCAPKQIYWCHGNFAYDVIGIDKRITHIELNAIQNKSNFEFSKFDAVQVEEHLKGEAPEEVYKNAAAQIKKRFSEDTVILGSIGRLVKIDNDEYLSAVAEIMKECPNTVYLACGAGNIDEIKQRAQKADVPLDRFYFEGHVDPHVYGYAIDVYLNTFPEPSGEALAEFISKGDNKYVVRLGL